MIEKILRSIVDCKITTMNAPQFIIGDTGLYGIGTKIKIFNQILDELCKLSDSFEIVPNGTSLDEDGYNSIGVGTYKKTWIRRSKTYCVSEIPNKGIGFLYINHFTPNTIEDIVKISKFKDINLLIISGVAHAGGGVYDKSRIFENFKNWNRFISFDSGSVSISENTDSKSDVSIYPYQSFGRDEKLNILIPIIR